MAFAGSQLANTTGVVYIHVPTQDSLLASDIRSAYVGDDFCNEAYLLCTWHAANRNYEAPRSKHQCYFAGDATSFCDLHFTTNSNGR